MSKVRRNRNIAPKFKEFGRRSQFGCVSKIRAFRLFVYMSKLSLILKQHNAKLARVSSVYTHENTDGAKSYRDVIWLRHCHWFFLAYQMKALGFALYLFDRLVVFIKTLVNLSIVISLIHVFRDFRQAARFTLSNCFCDHSRNFAWVNYSKFWRICKKCLKKLTECYKGWFTLSKFLWSQ